MTPLVEGNWPESGEWSFLWICKWGKKLSPAHSPKLTAVFLLAQHRDLSWNIGKYENLNRDVWLRTVSFYCKHPFSNLFKVKLNRIYFSIEKKSKIGYGELNLRYPVKELADPSRFSGGNLLKVVVEIDEQFVSMNEVVPMVWHIIDFNKCFWWAIQDRHTLTIYTQLLFVRDISVSTFFVVSSLHSMSFS